MTTVPLLRAPFISINEIVRFLEVLTYAIMCKIPPAQDTQTIVSSTTLVYGVCFTLRPSVGEEMKQ